MGNRILDKRSPYLIYFIEALVMMCYNILVYLNNIFFNNVFLAIISLIVFMFFYNIYNIRTLKLKISPPFWIFPLVIFVVSITSIYIKGIELFLYYVLLIILIVLISSIRMLNKLIGFLCKNTIYLYAIIFGMIIVYLTPLPYKSWIAFGPLVEFLIANYFIVIYKNSFIGVEGKNKLLYLYEFTIALLVSLIIYIAPLLVLYSFTINILKLIVKENSNAPICFILDMFGRFALLGGIGWIINML